MSIKSPLSLVTSAREGSQTRTADISTTIGVANTNYITFSEFKSALFEISKLVTKTEHNDEYLNCIEFIKLKLLSLALSKNEEKKE
jgi:hypothetical protein